MERERKNVIFLTVVAIATLLVAVVGATFAYFSTQVQSNITDNNNKVDIGTAKLSSVPMIIFDVTGNKINMANAVPGDSSSSSFTIENSSDIDLSYNISWKDVVSTFNQADEDYVGTAPDTQADELKYTVSCTATMEGSTPVSKTDITAPLTDGPIASNLVVKAKDTATCNITVNFIETNENQNYNQGRSFTGTINVDANPITN